VKIHIELPDKHCPQQGKVADDHAVFVLENLRDSGTASAMCWCSRIFNGVPARRAHLHAQVAAAQLHPQALFAERSATGQAGYTYTGLDAHEHRYCFL
jgi:hypothetical protein